MSEMYSSYRWNDPPSVSQVKKGRKQTKEELKRNKKDFLKLLTEEKQLTQEEADERYKKFVESLK